MRVLNEPTAAALAYGVGTNESKEKKIVVYDLGGGTLDVTIMTVQGNFFDVRSTSGDAHLGGEDFNKSIFDHLSNHFKTKEGIDISNNKRAKSRLFTAIEKAKLTLTVEDKTQIEIDNLAEGKDLSFNITRDQFAEICKPVFDKCIAPIQVALS